MALAVSILTPEGKAFEDEVYSITAPGVNGSFGVLEGHAPMIAALDTGVLKVVIGDGNRFFVVKGGFAEVRKDRLVVLSDRVEPADDGDAARGMAATWMTESPQPTPQE